jgi:hypothetical protein
MANPFESARPHLWNGEDGIGVFEKYLCHAIQRGAERKAVSQQEADQAQAMIRTRLGEYVTVESWLCCEAGIRLGQMDHLQVQSYRFLWLADLSAKWNQGERA